VKFSLDKYLALQVRWYGYVREVLKSEEVRETVYGSCKDGDIIVLPIVSCPATCWVAVRKMIAEQIAAVDDSCGGQ